MRQISWLCPYLGTDFQYSDKCNHITLLLQLLLALAVEGISFLSQMCG